jgi:5-methylcytosine-specific restriction endonuclease McrA
MPTRPPVHDPAGWQPPEVRQAQSDQARAAATARTYDAAWRKLRANFLKNYPACQTPGCTLPATQVDHVKSVRERPDLRLTWQNLRALCASCHSRRTARDQGCGAAARERAREG